MCFTNEPDRLTKLRARKTAITLWKSVKLDHKTGLGYSQYDGLRDRVWWKKGTIVHPHQIRKPIEGRHNAGAGLYFYTYQKFDAQWVARRLAARSWGKGGTVISRTWGKGDTVIKARVRPEDIIGVNIDGLEVCVIAAKVVDAPNPDQTKMRIKYLNKRIQNARDKFKEQKKQIAAWEAGESEQREVLQQMLDEVKELKK